MPRTSVVTGRDWSSHSTSSRPMAHSTSCGPPKVAATSPASLARARSRGRASRGPSLAVKDSDAPSGSSRYREPSTSPDTSGSGPPRTAVTTRRSDRPDTGSTPNMTPPTSGSSSGWTSTAMGWSSAPARSRDSSTTSTAVTNASKPWTPITEANWPAIDDSAVSSTSDELRATRSRSSPPASSNACRTAGCPATEAPASTSSQNAVVRTSPPSVRSPATCARARAAALPPVRDTSVAAVSDRFTTWGRGPGAGGADRPPSLAVSARVIHASCRVHRPYQHRVSSWDGSVVPHPRRDQTVAHHLAHGIAGQSRHFVHHAGPLVGGQPLGGPLPQGGGIEPRPRLDVSGHHLAPLGRRRAHDGHVDDTRMRPQDVLDLPGVHVVAPGDDQLLGPPHDGEVAGVVPGTDIAGVEPAVGGEGLGGGLGPPPVTGEHV